MRKLLFLFAFAMCFCLGTDTIAQADSTKSKIDFGFNVGLGFSWMRNTEAPTLLATENIQSANFTSSPSGQIGLSFFYYFNQRESISFECDFNYTPLQLQVMEVDSSMINYDVHTANMAFPICCHFPITQSNDVSVGGVFQLPLNNFDVVDINTAEFGFQLTAGVGTNFDVGTHGKGRLEAQFRFGLSNLGAKDSNPITQWHSQFARNELALVFHVL